MKKIYIALLIILSFVICLSACDDISGTTTSSTSPTIPDDAKLVKFVDMFNRDFDIYTISISSSSPNGDTVNKEYVVVAIEDGTRTVSYRIETINGFVIDGDEIKVPDEYKTVTEGKYNELASSLSMFDVPNFDFSLNSLETDYLYTESEFNGSIKSLESFMGLVEAGTTEEKLQIKYSDDIVESISISYISDNGNSVVITYTFN